MMELKSNSLPTMADWPKRIWSMDEFPDEYRYSVLQWIKKDFSEYDFVFVPKHPTSIKSFEYLFGYGDNSVLYIKKTESGMKQMIFTRSDIVTIKSKRELLDSVIILTIKQNEKEHCLYFPYVASTYYLFDSFLNWMLYLQKDFSLLECEKKNPRPSKLYQESQVMYNYSLNAFRLGDRFSEYIYHLTEKPSKIFPGKVNRIEYLEISMKHGTFQIFSSDYLTECTYKLTARKHSGITRVFLSLCKLD